MSPRWPIAADRLYGQLTEAGVEVLYDDRDVSPGVKFADADLLGMPVRLVVGAQGAGPGDGGVEVTDHRRGAGAGRRRPGGGRWSGG